MTRTRLFGVALLLAVAITVPAATQSSNMSFFITSAGPGDGANLGGLDGADRHCQMLAGGGEKTWRAYLSTTGAGGVNARDRIGSGPWHNYNDVEIASNVDNLHSDDNNLTKETQLNEMGQIVNGRGDTPNMHDILTGSQLDGRMSGGADDSTCGNWTNNGSDGSALVGHHDRQGGGANPTSWNSAHGSRGCGQSDLQGTGGNGFYYCFATN